MTNIILKYNIYDYSLYNKTLVKDEGITLFFDTVITGQLQPVSIVCDGTSQISQLPFREVLEIASSSNVDLELLRISNNRVKVYNSGSSTIEIEIGTTGSSRIFYLLKNKEANFYYNGTVWLHSEENIITMTNADLIMTDITGPTRVILPSSGITVDRTVTLPTLADNQNQVIRFDNFNTTYALFIDGEGSETIETVFTSINLSTEYSILEGTSSTWKRIGYSPIRPVYQIEHRETTGTAGGTATAGSYSNIPLTDEPIKEIIGASLASDQFTLPTGKYGVKATCQFFYGVESSSRIYSVTDAALVLNSLSCISTGGNVDTTCILEGSFVITDTKIFSYDYLVGTTRASDGLGYPTTSPKTYELYAIIILEKLI
jgi:hypothetical protein